MTLPPVLYSKCVMGPYNYAQHLDNKIVGIADPPNNFLKLIKCVA